MNRLNQLRAQWRSLILPIFILSYLAFLAIDGLAWAVIHRYLWQMDIMSNFTAWYFVPAPILLLIALIFKRRRWAALLVIPLLVFAVKYGPHFIPRETAANAVSDSPTLTVMTMNVLKRNTDWAAIKAQIQAANPDVITMQEIPDALLTDLWPSLAEMYPYNLHAPSPMEGANSGILSRYPFTEQASFYLPDEYQLAHVRVVVKLQDKEVVIYGLHLAAPTFMRTTVPSRIIGKIFPYIYTGYYRLWQMGAFYPKLAAETRPVLVMGDFNTADSSADYGTFKTTTGLQDTFSEVGFGLGFTFPTNIDISDKRVPFVPVMRLDYVWHSSQWQPLSAWLGGSTGSDHLPLIARLKLAN